MHKHNYEDYIENGIGYDWKGEKIVELDKDTGDIVWEWSAFDYFSLDDFDYLAGHWETAWNNNLQFDWIHFNALAYNDAENALYVSSRHLDRITKIDYSTKDIIWNLDNYTLSVEGSNEISSHFSIWLANTFKHSL